MDGEVQVIAEIQNTHNASLIMMAESISDYNDGASSIKESRQFFKVPGLARRDPPKRTGGSSVSSRGARRGEQRQIATGQAITAEPLRLLLWNAEEAHKKRDALKNSLQKEKIDVVCLQETHLNKNLRFTIRGYQKRSRERPKR